MHLLVVYCSVSVSVQKYITPTVSGQQMKVVVCDSSYNGEVLLGFKTHMNITLKKTICGELYFCCVVLW